MTLTESNITLAAADVATAQQGSAIGEGLSLMVVGMVVVFAALLLVGMALVLIRRIADDQPAVASSKTSAPSGAVPVTATPSRSPVRTTDELDQKLMAVIAAAAVQAQTTDTRLIAVLAAAASAAVGSPVRLRRVRVLNPRIQTSGAWAAAGRAKIHRSHHFPKRKPR